MTRHYIQMVKNSLLNTIDEMSQHPKLFAVNPEKDFSRKRKIDFSTFMKFTLNMSGSSLNKELFNYFNFSIDTPTVSAYSQQRAKVLPDAFEFLFHEFTTKTVHSNHLLEGYRLLACDGSRLTIPTNPKDAETYVRCNQYEKCVNQLHLNVFYDLLNRTYVDAIVQNFSEMNEFRACVQLIDRSQFQDKTILVADRGYENYNVFAHAIEKGWKFVVRVKDKGSNGILSGLHISKHGEFDDDISRILTRSQKKARKSKEYKFMPTCQTFDYVKTGSKEEYPISFRVVRLLLTDHTYETLITNLSREEFPPDRMRELYQMRWGIETSFRELKYAIGLSNFHAKKVNYIKQEIFARLVLYNYCEMITTYVVIQQSEKRKKHTYQVNFTLAIYICREYLKQKGGLSPPEVELLIRKNTLPIRYGRKDPRKVNRQKTVSFLYRVS